MREMLAAHPWHVGIIAAALLVLIVCELAARRWKRRQDERPPLKGEWHFTPHQCNHGQGLDGTRCKRCGIDLATVIRPRKGS